MKCEQYQSELGMGLGKRKDEVHNDVNNEHTHLLYY